MTGPLYRWSPPRRRSLGPLVCDLTASMQLKGLPYVMDVHQQAVLDDIFAEGDEVGIPAAADVTIVAPRRNIKTGVLIAAALGDLFVREVDRHVWTAHLDRTVRGSFREMRALIDSNPEHRALCRWPPTAGNQKAIELHSGPIVEFFTRSTGGGRGEGGDVTTLDENLYLTDEDLDSILPTGATSPHTQTRVASSAGLAKSKVLRKYRDQGRPGGEDRSAYWEYGATPRPCVRDGCEHLDLADPGCALNDRELWRQANPALGVRIRESFLEDMRRRMSPAGFAREFLSWWDEPDEADHPIDPDGWALCGIDPRSPDAAHPLAPLAISVECSNDRGMTTVGLAGRRPAVVDGEPDGKAQIELARRERGTGWLVDYVVERVGRLGPCAVVIDPSGPAGFLIPKLEQAGVEVTQPTGREVAQSCQDFQATVNDGVVKDPDTGEERPSELVHTRDVVLTSGVHAAEAKPSGAFDRACDHADALYAAALAMHGLTRGESADQPFFGGWR